GEGDSGVDWGAVDLTLVLKQRERTSRLSMMFLDACRDNPLATTLASTSRSVEVGRGLARIDKAVGMMIAFSTQPGNVALDSEGRNSPVTGALLRRMVTEGVSINGDMIDIYKKGVTRTDSKQSRWKTDCMTR